MRKILISSRPGYEEWREQARLCLEQNIPPHDILWQKEVFETDLFAVQEDEDYRARKGARRNVSVPKNFIALAELACCHSDAGRFALLYRILWRLAGGERNLLHLKTDDDVLKLRTLVKAARHDAYKIKAFLRFREVKGADEETFIAWYEPEHYTLELSLPFFQTRFKNMNWSILTPYRAAHWNKENLILDDNPNPSSYPKEDNIEAYWLTYYASIFNPARPKKQAMLNQMPKKYWKNMPETVLIKDMLNHAGERAQRMIQNGGGE